MNIVGHRRPNTINHNHEETCMFKILTINLGGTSSKFSLYDDLELSAEVNFQHTPEEMAGMPLSQDQLAFRKRVVLEWLGEQGLGVNDISAVVARCNGFAEVNKGGTYLITGDFKKLLYSGYTPDKPMLHGNDIAVPLGLELMDGTGKPVYSVDPALSCELRPIAKISGIKGFDREARAHLLNPRAVARKHADAIGKAYADCRFVIVHMGSGVSVSAYENGDAVDMNDAADGYGPMSPDRAGTVATKHMMRMCFEQGLSLDEVRKKTRYAGGVMSHLGTTDMREVEKRAGNADEYAQLILDAFIYQVAKEIGAYAAALKCDVDAILLTGGIAHSKYIVAQIEEYVNKLAPVSVYPGEMEGEAMAAGAYRVLSGQEQPRIYKRNSSLCDDGADQLQTKR